MEERLESILSKDISIASSDWMVIARQLPTPWGKRIDLLCISSSGSLVVLELKRSKTEREVVAQALDYGSYVRAIKPDEIPRLFARYQEEYCKDVPARSLEEAFCSHFGVKSLPEELNGEHELVIVASVLDPATERIVNYLAEEHDVRINAVFFRVFRDTEREYLTRVWLRDPDFDEESESGTTAASEKVAWNNEFYVNFAPSRHRSWEDAVKYGFVSAGFAPRFRDALMRLQPGNRIWVNVPGPTGYVGVGTVVESAVPVDQFLVQNEVGERVPITTAPHKATHIDEGVGDPDKVEYLVRVKWIKTVPVSQAVKERGLFGNQNVVAQPRDAKWPHTISRLKQHFGVQD
ncbi:MAG: DUF91 domain-containing protein [Phycisphaerales bacterium]|nr:DUF91 domain-containing protein [Phycisphaerales bacterium]